MGKHSCASDECRVVLAVLLFSPIGYCARLLSLHLLSSDHWAAEPFGVYIINMVASFVLGFIGTIPVPKDRKWLVTGIGTGFCGCASTFGSLVAISSSSFIASVQSHSFYNCMISLSFLMVGAESSRASFDSGVSAAVYWTAKRTKKASTLPITHITKEETDERQRSYKAAESVTVWIALVAEVVVWIVLLPFFQTTSVHVFGIACTYIGALLRYTISKGLNSAVPSFFWGTFLCNGIGSCIATGVKVALKGGSFSLPLTSFLSALSSGFASALSTMSTFAKETNSLKEKSFTSFLLYSSSSLLLSFVLCCVLIVSFLPSSNDGWQNESKIGASNHAEGQE